MKNINDMALMKVKDERKRQNLLFLLDDIDSAYKREAYGAAFICCLILPYICSSIDRNDGKQSADTDYIDWWNENISPLFKADLVITKKKYAYHLSGAVGYALRCHVLHAANPKGSRILKELKKYYSQIEGKNVNIKFHPTASHFILLCSEIDEYTIDIEISINRQIFTKKILDMVLEKYLDIDWYKNRVITYSK